MSIYTSIYVDIEDAIRTLAESSRWDLLQLLWDNLKRNGGAEDWQSFFDDNGIAKKKED